MMNVFFTAILPLHFAPVSSHWDSIIIKHYMMPELVKKGFVCYKIFIFKKILLIKKRTRLEKMGLIGREVVG